jgi:hypothetical protein
MANNAFRPLNDNEFHMLEKLLGIRNLIGDAGHIPLSIDWESLNVSYENFAGGFTVCLIRFYVTLDDYQTAFIWRGVSRCARGDRFNKTRAEALAFKRAIVNSRPVEI